VGKASQSAGKASQSAGKASQSAGKASRSLVMPNKGTGNFEVKVKHIL